MPDPHALERAFDDEELVEACRAGKVEAYENLYRTHGARMKSIACNMLGNMSEAEDAVQETFLKIYRNIGRFRRQSAFTTWIHSVLVNTCRDQMRKMRKHGPTGSSTRGDTGGVDAAAEPPDHSLRVALQNALRQLRPRERTVFVLYAIEGFKHREVAEILGIPEGTSKSTLLDAKRTLQGILQSDAGGMV